MEKLNNYIKSKFGVDESRFLEVLQKSPGAEGYILGNLAEEEFKDYANSLGYDALRIKEKPEGGNNSKSEDARGDFYIRKFDSKKDEWLVVECKGVKSNSEKRCGLTSVSTCVNFLKKHSVIRNKHIESIYKSGLKAYKSRKENYNKSGKDDFPDFRWNNINPGSGVPDLSGIWKNEDEIKSWIKSIDSNLFCDDAFWNLTAPIRLLQTHMPSSRIDPVTKIKSTGPLVSEFNILCVDLFLKTGKHEFVFVNSAQLNHQAKSPNHLQQNYTIDILVEKDNFSRHSLLKPWYDNLDFCIQETNPVYRKLDETQLDRR